MKITKMIPISYCFGVTKAINEALKIRQEYKNKNIYFFGDLVHNENVINFFKSLKIEVVPFTKDNAILQLEKFCEDDIVIFSAHGHDKKYEDILIKNGVTYFDTTCIRVKKNLEIIKNSQKEIIFIGKEKHPETIACLSYSQKIFLYDVEKKYQFDYSLLKTSSPLILNQTTLSFLELEDIFIDIKKHFENAEFIDEICDASRVRQQKILNLPNDVDLVVVVGSKKSSNSTKLFELSCLHNKNVKTIMVNSVIELTEYDLSAYHHALIASGTSTPLNTINEIENYLIARE